jgi:hypothetical protein
MSPAPGAQQATKKPPSFKDMMLKNALDMSGLGKYKKLIDDLRAGKGAGALNSLYF